MAAILTILALSILFCSYDAAETDVYCLKSFFTSVEDPFGYLATSWDFSNNTEGFICNFIGVGCWHPDENKVLSLRISGMGLRGSFPRGLSNCTSLTGLDLSRNNFSGPIPPDIAHMLTFLTTLDLSINNFSGEIPDGIADLSYLNIVNMDNNRLQGRIPHRLGSLSRLKVFSVANNNLSGEVPVFSDAYYFTAESYAGNPGLCGPPLKPCRHDKPRKKLPIEFVGGFAVGYVIFFLLAVVGFMVLSGRQKKVVAMRKETQFVGLLRTNRSNIRIKFLNLEKYLNRMSFTEIKRATSNFNEHGVISVGENRDDAQGNPTKRLVHRSQETIPLSMFRRQYYECSHDSYHIKTPRLGSTLGILRKGQGKAPRLRIHAKPQPPPLAAPSGSRTYHLLGLAFAAQNCHWRVQRLDMAPQQSALPSPPSRPHLQSYPPRSQPQA